MVSIPFYYVEAVDRYASAEFRFPSPALFLD
jgi:hypothetical protein